MPPLLFCAVRARLEYITQLEAEVQDLKHLRTETAQRALVAESEKENIAAQALRNQEIAGQNRKLAVVTEQQAVVERTYLLSQYARAKANEEEALRQLKEVSTENHFLKLDFASAKLQHTAQVKHLERDIQILKDEKVSTVHTLVENYEKVIHEQIVSHRDFMEEVIDFLKHIVDLADGLKVKQVKIDSVADIERRTEDLENFNRVTLKDYVKDAKDFLLLDPLLREVALGKEIFKTAEELEALRLSEESRLEAEELANRDREEAVLRDREERARIRTLAEEAPRLQALVQQLEGQVRELRAENDDLKVALSKQDLAIRRQQSDALQVSKAERDGPGGTHPAHAGVGARGGHGAGTAADGVSDSTDDAGPAGPAPAADRGDTEPEMAAADVEVRLDRSFDEIPEGSEARRRFEELFLEDVARALGVSRELLQIREVRRDQNPVHSARAAVASPSHRALAWSLGRSRKWARALVKDEMDSLGTIL